MNKKKFIKLSALFVCLLASSCGNTTGTSSNVETFNLKNGAELKVKRENVNCVFNENFAAACTAAGILTSLSGTVSDWYAESEWSCNSEWSWAEWNSEFGNGRRMTGNESKTKIVPGHGNDDACNIASKVGYSGMK